MIDIRILFNSSLKLCVNVLTFLFTFFKTSQAAYTETAAQPENHIIIYLAMNFGCTLMLLLQHSKLFWFAWSWCIALTSYSNSFSAFASCGMISNEKCIFKIRDACMAFVWGRGALDGRLRWCFCLVHASKCSTQAHTKLCDWSIVIQS